MGERPPNVEGVRQQLGKRRARPATVRAEQDGGNFVRDLPADCPVDVLGHDEQGRVVIIDAAGLLWEIPPDKLARLYLIAVFGDPNYLWLHWPRKSADGHITGWKPEQVAESVTRASRAKGVIDTAEKVRGRGAWRGGDGGLVLHCGDRILIQTPGPDGVRGNVRQHAPGQIDGYIYSRAGALPLPWKERVAEDGSPAAKLLAIFRTWRWARDDLDALLLLGWVVASLAGGALRWRPLAWITGRHGSGKSTLMAVLKATCGDWLIQVSDTSAAGVWQRLRHSTLAHAFDEAEAEEDGRRLNAVVKLARQAASGGRIARGGQDHQGVEFTVRSTFLFSSIVIPPLLPADRSRIAILALRDRASGGLTLDWTALPVWGTQLHRRVLDEWDRLDALIEVYRTLLAERGHDARGADLFGTLLACADLALFDQAPGARDAGRPGFDPHLLIERLAVGELAETADDHADERMMLRHLLTTAIDPWRNGTRRLVAEWLRQAIADLNARDRSLALGEPDPELQSAARALQLYGLKLHVDEAGRRWFAIANSHAELATLFKNTRWQTMAGVPVAPWAQAAGQLAGAVKTPQGIYLYGGNCRCTLVPIETLGLDA